MEQVMSVVNWLMANGTDLIAGIVGFFAAALVVALMIPGEHPDKELQAVVDFLKKFSRK